MTTTARTLTKSQATKAYREVLQVLASELGYRPFIVHPVVEQGAGRWPEGPVLCKNFDDRPGYAVVWEEGDYDWVLLDGLRTQVNGNGVYVEAINGWSLGLYPA